MQILVGKHSGFCFGVQRAVRLAEEAAKNGAVYTYGNIIHNEDVVEELRQKGIVPVSDLESLKPGEGCGGCRPLACVVCGAVHRAASFLVVSCGR